MSVDKVLLVVSTPSQFPDMKRLATMLKASGQIEPIVAFNYSINYKSEWYHILSGLGITCYDYSQGLMLPRMTTLTAGENHSQTSVNPFVSEIKKEENTTYLSTKDKIKKNYPRLFKIIKYIVFKIRYTQIDFFSLIIRILRRKYKERRLLYDLNIKLIILGEDSVDYFTSGLVSVANQKSIKVLIFPYTLSASLEFLVEAYFNRQFVNRNLMYKLTSLIFPKWTIKYKDQILLKSRPALIWSVELFDRSPPEPWIMNSGYSDAIVVESSFMLDYFKRAGIPEAKLKVLGFPVLDELKSGIQNRDSNRQKWAKELGLNPSKMWVLCSFPPNQSPREALGTTDYSQILERYFNSLDTVRNQVEVLSLFHPRADRDDYLPVCNRLGVKVINADISTILPMVDIFIASVSSTIRWALACGIPVINFDIYKYDYNDFVDTNVKTVFESAEFKTTLQNMVDTLSSQRQEPKPDPYFGNLNQKTSEVLIDYLKKQIN